MPNSRVFIRSAAVRSVDDAVADVMGLCGWEQVVPAGARVVVKPNLCTPSLDIIDVANTSPEVLSAVCAVLKSRTDNVAIVESDGIRYSAEEAFSMSGTYEIGKRFGFEVKSLSKDELVEVEHRRLKGWGLAKTLLECDVFMTIAKVKTHATTTFTGALKNQWGCIAQHDRILLHKYLHTLIGDINKILAPKLGIMDGLVGMEGRGPINGPRVHLNVIMGSRDVVALDAAAMRFVGLEPMEAAHIVHAAKIGLGEIEPARMDVDADCQAVKQFDPAEKDWPIKVLNLMSHSTFLTRHLLMNDAVFFPARWFANACRAAKARLRGTYFHSHSAGKTAE